MTKTGRSDLVLAAPCYPQGEGNGVAARSQNTKNPSSPDEGIERGNRTDETSGQNSKAGTLVKLDADLSVQPMPCLYEVNRVTDSRSSHGPGRRMRIELNLALMNVAAGGMATPDNGTPAVVSPLVIEIDLTHRAYVDADVALARMRAFVSDCDFVSMFGDALAVLGRGERGTCRLHTHIAAALRQQTAFVEVKRLVERLARRNGFGYVLLVEPLRSVEGFGYYLANNAEDVRRTVPKGTSVVWFSRSANRVTAKFGWRKGFSRHLRHWIARFAQAVGVEDMEGFCSALGSRWHGLLTQQYLLTRRGKTTDEVMAWFKVMKTAKRTATPRVPKAPLKRRRTPKAPARPNPRQSTSRETKGRGANEPAPSIAPVLITPAPAHVPVIKPTQPKCATADHGARGDSLPAAAFRRLVAVSAFTSAVRACGVARMDRAQPLRRHPPLVSAPERQPMLSDSSRGPPRQSWALKRR